MLQADPTIVVFRILAMLFAISIHEYAHAAVAYQLGDKSQESLGRLTLNPLAHLDPVGALLLVFFGFGWAKPVQINPYALRGSPRRAMLLVSLAGVGCNFLAAVVFGLPSRLGVAGNFSYLIQVFLEVNVYINLILAAFNLIPIPPLDGSKALMSLLPGRQAYQFAKVEAYGPILLMALILTGMTGVFMNPILKILHFLATGR